MRNGEIRAKDEQFVVLNARALAGRYPFRLYEYSAAGDYIGIIRKNGGLVDFHITSDHQLLRDPTWRNRVVTIDRVMQTKLPEP